MLLLDHGYAAATAGHYHLIRLQKCQYGGKLHYLNGRGRSHHTSEASAGLFLYKIALPLFHGGLFHRHMTSDDLLGIIESLIVRIHGDLGQDRGH